MDKIFASLLVGFTFLCLCLSFGGCKKSSPGANNETSRPAASSGSAAKVESKGPQRPELLSEGQKAVCKDVEITLIGTRKAAEYTKTPDEGKEYVVLKFKVKNTGSEKMYGDVSSDLQWLDTDSGRREGYERTTGVKLDNPENSDLAPGQEAEYEAVYMMPKDITEVEFHYVPGYNPIEKARWKIKIQ